MKTAREGGLNVNCDSGGYVLSFPYPDDHVAGFFHARKNIVHLFECARWSHSSGPLMRSIRVIEYTSTGFFYVETDRLIAFFSLSL